MITLFSLSSFCVKVLCFSLFLNVPPVITIDKFCSGIKLLFSFCLLDKLLLVFVCVNSDLLIPF